MNELGIAWSRAGEVCLAPDTLKRQRQDRKTTDYERMRPIEEAEVVAFSSERAMRWPARACPKTALRKPSAGQSSLSVRDTATPHR